MSEKKQISFTEVNKLMSQTSKYGGVASEGTVSRITDYISTGNYMLNACMTGSIFKGIPANRATCLSGDSSTGKSFLLLNMCREAIKRGYYVLYYDSEFTIDDEQMKSFGIDTAKVRYEPIETVQEFKSSVVSILDAMIAEKERGNEVPKFFVALDSLGNLATQKEIDDAKTQSDKADMTRAKLIRSTFRMCLTKLGKLDSAFVFTNHVYQSQDMFGGTIQSGGKGLVYGASVILNLSKGKLKEEGNIQTGVRVFAVPQKNRFCVPTPIEFNISYIKGMNPYVGLEKYVSWENCGIGRGKFITDKDYEKLKDADKSKCKEVICQDGTIKYFLQSDSGRNICTDDGNTFGLRELWTPAVFTEERLLRIDEVISAQLSYSQFGEEELEDVLSSENISDTEDNEI